MPVHNSEISDILREVADLLDIEGADDFRVRSYRQAAQSIDNLSENLRDLVEQEKDLTELSGIGESIAEKIKEIVSTGSLKQLEELKQRVPEELGELLSIEGLGPKRVEELHEELGIDSREDLEKALKNHKVRELEGFGEKMEANIKKELERTGGEQRTLLRRAEEYAEPLVYYLQELDAVDRVEVAGSYRRRKETVGDLDILVTCSKKEQVINHFTSYEDVKEVLSKGETRSSVRLRSDLQVDLRVISNDSYGAALVYFTGSKQHNIQIRERALDRDLKINEYGVFEEGKEQAIAGKTEEEVYTSVDLPVIPPELREDRGEIEAAENKSLPKLVTLDDLQGDLHMHTTYSDGETSVKKMAEAARELGHRYIAITDHSKRVTVANGMDADELDDQIQKIEEVDYEIDDIRILKGIEVDILDDGTLDLPDKILERLDLRICSIHYKFNLSEEQQTKRILKAMENPLFNILAHPTGRQMPNRDEMELDMDAIMDAALNNGCFMELNATPQRLDLNDRYCRMAKERGLKVAISTDAHSTGELDYLKYGVYQARRGWLEKEDVINTRDIDELLKLLEK
ncbi:MAG: DNA polymerase/3'-5' exonuclease PolX [Balneolaceae bacterium]|nr:DNA polymerase/3'-5' exonuclease PolX [Balneolaceae bacterium]